MSDDTYQVHRHASDPPRRRRQGDRPRRTTAPTSRCQGCCTALCVRSPHAHARIVSIDTAAAEAMPGVKAVDDRHGHRPKTDAQARRSAAKARSTCATWATTARARQGALPRPRGGRGGGNVARDRTRGGEAHRGRLRAARPPVTERRARPWRPTRRFFTTTWSRKAAAARTRQAPTNIAGAHGAAARRRRQGLRRSRRRRRARVPDADGAPGLHRAARLRGARRARTAASSSGARTQGPFLVRDACAGDPRHRCGEDQGHPQRDRRRLRRQDSGLPRAARDRCCRARRGRPVKMVMTRDEVFRATGPTSGHEHPDEDRREARRHDRRRAARRCGTRPAPIAARRPGPARCAASRPTHPQLLHRSATTSSSTSRRWRPIARRARRWRRSRPSRSSTRSRATLGDGSDRAAAEERRRPKATRRRTGRSTARSA